MSETNKTENNSQESQGSTEPTSVNGIELGPNSPSLESLGIDKDTAEDTKVSTKTKEAELNIPNTEEYVRPEKFKSEEEMAKAYLELEKQFREKGTEPKGKPKEDVKEDPADNTKDTESKETGPKTIDLDSYTAEFIKNGELSTESYAEIEKGGYSNRQVDQYVAGQKAIGDAMAAQVFESVGGQEKFTEIAEWASKNLSEARQKLLNSTFDTGNVEDSIAQMQVVLSEYNSSVPNTGRLLEAKPAGGALPANQAPFTSKAQMKEAFGSKEYKNDPAFRATCATRLANSNIDL